MYLSEMTKSEFIIDEHIIYSIVSCVVTWLIHTWNMTRHVFIIDDQKWIYHRRAHYILDRVVCCEMNHPLVKYAFSTRIQHRWLTKHSYRSWAHCTTGSWWHDSSTVKYNSRCSHHKWLQMNSSSISVLYTQLWCVLWRDLSTCETRPDMRSS